jgi:hypothetical protein
MLAGEQAIGGLYSSAYGAYYGTLTQKPGLNLLRGTQVVPRFYQNADNTSGYTYSENRISAMVWSMAKSQIPYGIVIDAGSHVIIANGAVNVRGVSSASTSVLILDARSVAWSDLPVFHRPGKPNAVETAALLGATLHFVRPGDAAVLTGMSRGHSSIPGLFHMDQNYPNPFNPSTTIRFSIPHSGSASLSIYDLLGRQVAHLFDHDVQPGVYEVRWNAAGSASGVYVARLDRRTDGVMQSESRKIVLCK